LVPETKANNDDDDILVPETKSNGYDDDILVNETNTSGNDALADNKEAHFCEINLMQNSIMKDLEVDE
jgi:hypothetical protein